MVGGNPTASRRSGRRNEVVVLLACLAALFPFLLIVYVLSGFDLVEIPHVQIPTSQNYADAIGRVASTSDSLVTIALTILGADVIWFLRDQQAHLIRHIGMYVVFLGCVTSIYLGTKLGYSAALTLSGVEPDIRPLLSLLRSESLLVLLSGLLLTGIVIFGSLTSEKS